MTTIFAGTKQHNDAPHAETIEISESTGVLFHTIIHPNGTVAHETIRTLTPEHTAQYISHIDHWRSKGFGAEHISYTPEQHASRVALHQKHAPDPRLLSNI